MPQLGKGKKKEQKFLHSLGREPTFLQLEANTCNYRTLQGFCNVYDFE